MAEQAATVCQACGARLNANDATCALCGYSNSDQPADSTPTPAETTPASTDQVFCHQCGWARPSEARFCSSCGAKLQEGVRKAARPKKKAKSVADVPEQDESPAAVSGVSVGVIVGSSVLLVALLYLMTAYSKGSFDAEPPVQAQAPVVDNPNVGTSSPPPAAAATAPPPATSNNVSAELAEAVARLEAEAEGLEGAAWTAKQNELIALFTQAGLPNRAGEVQERVAQMSGAAGDWIHAGNMFYDWMENSAGQTRLDAAQRAIAAYEKGLAITPDDLDLRVVLAMAYMNTQAPMQGVMQIRSVLEEDPDHVQGNYYFGAMLMQINRIPQARQQFEKVLQLATPDSPVYQQAEMMLQNIQTLAGDASS